MMSTRTEAAASVLAALLVLFSAMLDPWVSVTLAVAFLAALAAFKLIDRARHGGPATTVVIDDRRAGADGGAGHRQVTRTDLDVEC
jgi:hypothetical protein